ncbi:class I SAM-dependent methyltransferase [Ruminococcaceae bacterium OttesenSCG-928-A11]|nr:class I SAM-dependent methyltransferase [Ruminococcaceae bacterium OttesenSCG-928-A11]
MRPADGWRDYELLDATAGFRLERWGDVLLQRPDPQVIWQDARYSDQWQDVDAVYHRSEKGGGKWEYRRRLPERWEIGYKALTFIVSPTGFKHTGVFPEQAANWEVYDALIRAAKRPVKVLNLFGYTGGATLACLAAGASVTHVDASRGMVAWARENAAASGLADKPVRWMVDDCQKFVAREQRRGSLYDAVIMDPPSYGRGPGGEVWKLEEAIWPLLELTVNVLNDHPLFFAVNSYTTGLAPGVAGYMLGRLLPGKCGGTVHSGEIGLPVAATGGVLPCGSTAIWRAGE